MVVLDCCFHASLTPIQWSKSFPSENKNYSSKEQEEFRKMQLHQYFHPFWGARGVQKNVIAPIYSSILRSIRSLEKCNWTNIFIHSKEHEEFGKMQLHQYVHPFRGTRRGQNNAIAQYFHPFSMTIHCWNHK